MTINGIKQITGLSRVWRLSDERLNRTLKKYKDNFESIVVQKSKDGEFVNFIALVTGDLHAFALLVDESRTDIDALKLMVEEESIIFPREF